ncbi:hypothetical protein CJF32_00002016 [Rutstroemia sp. NJR-2017a WRK4]|nr:hypothetical protein CJF32_00002016 [Rutstroemia sp. NJR-2017a WRK4]
MSYNVYLNGNGTGFVYQITGSTQTGMEHDHKSTQRPEDSASFAGLKKFLGTVSHENYSSVASVVDGIPPPKKQFDGPRRIAPKEPLRRCQEWT